MTKNLKPQEVLPGLAKRRSRRLSVPSLARPGFSDGPEKYSRDAGDRARSGAVLPDAYDRPDAVLSPAPTQPGAGGSYLYHGDG